MWTKTPVLSGANYVIIKPMRKRLLSGIQPSGTPHIGNYFGAMKQFVDLQNEHECFIFIADYHALHTVKDPEKLNANIKNVILDYLAIGLDPDKVTLYKQSDIAEHTELAWIFETLTTMPYLMRAHAFKDAEAKNKDISVGTFAYPLLMASDILLYDPDIVPVGADQKQHVEIARDTAQKFNNAYGETFKMPKEKIIENVAVVPGTDGQKMSKSYKNTIPLFGTKDEIAKAVMSIVTDSGGESPEHVYAIHRYFRSGESLATLYKQNKGNYKASKEALIEDIEALIGPMRQMRESITDDDVKKILREGSEKAHAIAGEKMKDVHAKVGVDTGLYS